MLTGKVQKLSVEERELKRLEHDAKRTKLENNGNLLGGYTNIYPGEKSKDLETYKKIEQAARELYDYFDLNKKLSNAANSNLKQIREDIALKTEK